MGISTGDAPGRAGGNRRQRSNGVHDALTIALANLRMEPTRARVLSRAAHSIRYADRLLNQAKHKKPIEALPCCMIVVPLPSDGSSDSSPSLWQAAWRARRRWRRRPPLKRRGSFNSEALSSGSPSVEQTEKVLSF